MFWEAAPASSTICRRTLQLVGRSQWTRGPGSRQRDAGRVWRGLRTLADQPAHDVTPARREARIVYPRSRSERRLIETGQQR